MRAHERLLKYVTFDTASREGVDGCPSTPGQKVLGAYLAEELRELGLSDARMDENGYVYASLPENAPGYDAIGLIAHVDTVDAVPSSPVKPRIIPHYDGQDIALENGLVTRLSDFPTLARYAGQTLIVTDGNTLLGADDKAGVAEIVTALEHLAAHPEIRHGRVCVAFTPDEEIGAGADRFDVAGFGADYAYTVDGGELGGIEYENFNAAAGDVTVHGVNIHPGSAKNRMKNAALMAVEFIGMLPPAERPEHTEGYEGFYHLCRLEGDEETARFHYIIRDHDAARFAARKARFEAIGAYLNGVYGAGSFEVKVTDTYYNMAEKIAGHMEIVERAKSAMRAAGVEPSVEPIRGGTDGARLSWMGLPCPNLSTGGMNYHGRNELICVESMDKMSEVLVNILRAQ